MTKDIDFFKKKNEGWVITLPDFKNYHKTKEIMTMLIKHKDRYIKQYMRI